jgi:PAS domain S-box-containing protein
LGTASRDQGQADRLWRALVTSSPDDILVTDPDGTVLFINRVRPPFEGYTIVGEKIWRLSPNADPEERLRGVLRRVVATREPIAWETLGIRPDGSRGWFETRALPLLIDGAVDRVVFIASDVTERKLASDRLAASERRFRALVEHGEDSIILIGRDGVVQYATPALLRALGLEPHEVVGHAALDLLHPEDRAVAAAAARDASPGTVTQINVRFRRRDGGWRWFEGKATNLVDDPAVGAVVYNGRDVTGRKAVDERLAFQAELLSQVNEPVAATDAKGHITYWNQAAADLYGYSEAEALAQDSEALLRARWPLGRDAMVTALKAAGHWTGEIVHTTKAGDAVIVQVSVRLQRDGGGHPTRAIAVMQDVTARKHMEEQLRQSQKMEAIGVLAGGVAHDFNNVLAVILGFTELVSRKLPPGNPVTAELDEVTRAAKRGGELTRRLLTFSRKQILQARPIDLGAAIAEFSRMIRRILGEDVEVEFPPVHGKLLVRADAVHLEQVLLNLCTNARQAMPRGGRLHVAARRVDFDDAAVARRPWARAGAFAQIEVADTGVGMDEPTRARVFEPFFTTKEAGTGLGLATVYGIVRQHGGFIHLESAPDVGTTVHVYLPLMDAATVMTPPAASRPPGAAVGGHETVLVAEDEPSIRALITITLTELGYEVIATSNGEDAVREYERRARDIALVVLDVVMPRLGAREAYERMCSVRPDVKVVFVTGYAPESTRLAELLESTRIPLLEKPFAPHALAAMVRSAIDG